MNRKLAAGLKKGTTLIFKRLEQILQDKIDLLVNDKIELLSKQKIEKMVALEVQIKMNEYADYREYSTAMQSSGKRNNDDISSNVSCASDSLFDTPRYSRITNDSKIK